MTFFKIISTLLLIQLIASASSAQFKNLNFIQYSKANSDFTSDFFHQITEESADSNIIVSPASVQVCLAMLYMGTKGQTADELVKGLHFTTSNKIEIAERAKKVSESLDSSVKIANRIYLNKDVNIKPEFNDIAKNSFKAEAESLDFSKAQESSNIINKWVETKTNNRIKNLVTPSSVSDAHMILVNAIYFKGKWVHTFEYSVKSDFWYNKESKVETDIMKQTKYFNYADIKELNAKVIEMPYAGSDISMLIILPNARDGLTELENKLQNTDLMKTALELNYSRVRLSVPKFEFEYNIKLNDILKKMGMTTMFSSAADFSDLISESIQVTQVVHKAFIKVDENGSEAAAATVITGGPLLATMSNQDKPEVFNADHPFVFVIKNRNGILFVGHVVKF